MTSVFQTNIGMRMSVMPGARILKIVAMKLIEPRIELMPSSTRPMIHRSCRPRRALGFDESGA